MVVKNEQKENYANGKSASRQLKLKDQSEKLDLVSNVLYAS